MGRMNNRLAISLAMLAAGCLDTASNYNEVLPPVQEDQGPITPGQPSDGNPAPDGSGGADGSPSADGSDVVPDGSDVVPDGSAGDASTEAPFASAIKGSAFEAGCSSYGKETATACAGFFCGVTEEVVAQELPHFSGKCEPTPEDVCSGKITFKVASCARSVKSNPLNAFDSKETLRMKTQDCVYEDTTITASVECLGCFLDAAQCASDHCLTQCLGGDSANCDKCRLDNNCNQPVPLCAGTPNPF